MEKREKDPATRMQRVPSQPTGKDTGLPQGDSEMVVSVSNGLEDSIWVSPL